MIESILTKRNVKTKTKITIKSIIAVGLVALSVALPQLVHLVAGAQGGMTWLPMYLPVLIGGCLLGARWGLAIGICSPIISFILTSISGSAMPTLERLPFMIFELAVFSLISGAFSKKIAENKWIAFPAVLFAQIGGRIAFFASVAISQNLVSFNFATIWYQIQSGFIGVIIQALIVPLIIIALSKFNRKNND